MADLLYTCQPITDWTAFGTRDRTPNPFRASWASTQDLLRAELTHLQARDVVLELALQAGQIRRDGLPRADAKIDNPAVRLTFQSSAGPLTYATDRFEGRWSNDPADWQINLRAIALGLEALRKVDRYGIGQSQQYAGYRALPAGRSAPPTRTAAATLLDRIAMGPDAEPDDDAVPNILKSIALAKSAHRSARINAHPDRHGGDQTLWDQVEQAAEVLGLS